MMIWGWRLNFFTFYLVFFTSVHIGTTVHAQDGVPIGILKRTVNIKSGTIQGTGFFINHGGKVYLITARHVVSGVSEKKAILQVKRLGQWVNLQTVRTLFPSVSDVDIAVFETDEKPEAESGFVLSGNVTMGQQIWFLGYPAILNKFSDFDIPFIKRGTMSAVDSSNRNAVIFYIDGFNNPGFSGGPIVFWDFEKRQYNIIGVVQGYRADTAKVMVKGDFVDTDILVNSGILVGYSIKHALDAIDGR